MTINDGIPKVDYKNVPYQYSHFASLSGEDSSFIVQEDSFLFLEIVLKKVKMVDFGEVSRVRIYIYMGK